MTRKIIVATGIVLATLLVMAQPAVAQEKPVQQTLFTNVKATRSKICCS